MYRGEILSERNDEMPFLHVPGDKIGGGFRSDVFTLGGDWVLKTIKPQWQQGNWEERLVGDYLLLKDCLGDHVPYTGFVKGKDFNGVPNLFMVQKRVQDARPLRHVPWAELRANGNSVEQFTDFAAGVHLMYEKTGKTPDLHGTHVRQYDFKLTKNVLVDSQGRVWLVDIDRLGPLWSEKWIGGKIHMKLTISALDRFMKKLKGE